jgi:glycosyltransferase involved in cell wall biosynthesis
VSQLTLGVLTFNDSNYLQKLLESIENQNDRNFELLIVNNSSTDSTQSMITKFSAAKHDYEIKIIHNVENIGSFLGTRQLILKNTTSHLSIIHGDDLLKSNYVEVANSYIHLYPDFCAFNFDLEEIEGFKDTSTGNVIKSSWTNFKTINRLLVSGLNPGVMPGSVINTIKFDEIFLSGDFEGLKLNGTEDIFLWQQIIRSSRKIMRVPITTYLYRRHSGQISKNYQIYGASLGYARRVNFLTAKTRIEKLLCAAEIEYEFSTVNYDNSYIKGLGHLLKYRVFSVFRFLNIVIRRTARLINNII